MTTLGITWNPSEGIDLGFFMIRYYSLMFVVAFSLGYYLTKKIFIREGESIENLDSLFVWTAIATLVGARLGHVFFYDWDVYKHKPLEIFLPFRFDPFEFTGFSGLASHGAAIAIVIAMFFYSKKVIKRPVLWILDRIVVAVASGAIFVRLGNFFNSEIYGHPTSGSNFYAIRFVKDDEFWSDKNPLELTQKSSVKEAFNAVATDPKFQPILDQIPFRHPSQLYEAFGYIFVFLTLYYAYWKTDARNKPGLLLGIFLVFLFTVRFIVEFVKESQGGFEGENPILSTGQWLSIPCVIIGLILIFTANNRKTQNS
ncbi:prolipoprotein diacylglyceryl transferase [Flavobacterium aurantiibacter]|uniref:Phosphatidylglycerol--prolipoprotein diacylglyceryl transferase n=1 Tax=Flavobacterium aurantiibacter TaxID=2023067 RepID=A0A255ZPN2_9FLAO|nr:prolipoprotein diacylglyceryl transferase [Flavobacterium aurantiibacter]OYQ43463.1 prolipoprotein diacylglyceryl transferase [Flavobacterium aurantiibacter]